MPLLLLAVLVLGWWKVLRSSQTLPMKVLLPMETACAVEEYESHYLSAWEWLVSLWSMVRSTLVDSCEVAVRAPASPVHSSRYL